MAQEQSRDRKIATQSNLKLVNEWASQCGCCLTLKELVAITNVMNDYVDYGYSAELGERLEKIQKYLDDKRDQ